MTGNMIENTTEKQTELSYRAERSFAGAARAAIWIGVLVTASVCLAGWGGGVAWILWARGAAHLVDYSAEIFMVSAASLFCAVVATLSALVALCWKSEVLGGWQAAEEEEVVAPAPHPAAHEMEGAWRQLGSEGPGRRLPST